MQIRSLFLTGIVVALSACSGGGGGGAGGGNPTVTAGYLAAPTASCAGSACIPGASLSSASLHATAVANPNRAIAVYEAFNNGFITQLNSFLAKIYAGMVAGGSESCMDVLAGSGTWNGYDFTLTLAGTDAIPTGFTKAGSNYNYRIEASVTGTPVANIQVYCGTDTTNDPLTVTALVKENGDQYHFVYEKSGHQIRVMGGGILSGGDKMVAWFKTNDGNDFDLEVVSNVNSISDHWKARGNKSGNKYNILETVSSDTACINSTGGAADCTGFNINASASLAVTSSTNWNTVTDSNFTVGNP